MQRVSYQAGTSLCVSDALVEYLVCLEGARLTQVSAELKKALAGNVSGGQEDVQAAVKLEASAIEQVTKTYGTHADATAVETCKKVYERRAGITIDAGVAAPDVIAQSPAITVSGIVTDETNKGLSDVKILIVGTGDEGMTSSSGSFVIGLARPGLVSMHLERAGFEVLNEDVRAPANSLRLKLKRDSARALQQRQPASTIVCYPTSAHGDTRGCSVQCDKGPGNPLTQFHTLTVTGAPACEQYATQNCNGTGVWCSYDYVPLATP